MSSVYSKMAEPFTLDQIIAYLKQDYAHLEPENLSAITRYVRQYSQDVFTTAPESNLCLKLQAQALERIRELLMIHLVHHVTTSKPTSFNDFFMTPHPQTGIRLLEYAFFGRTYNLLDLCFQSGVGQSNLAALELVFRRQSGLPVELRSGFEVKERDHILMNNYQNTQQDTSASVDIDFQKLWSKHKFLFLSLLLGGVLSLSIAPFTGGLAPVFYGIGVTSILGTSVSIWQTSKYQQDAKEASLQAEQKDNQAALLKYLLKEVERDSNTISKKTLETQTDSFENLPNLIFSSHSMMDTEFHAPESHLKKEFAQRTHLRRR